LHFEFHWVQFISKEWLPTASVARVVFFPLFAVCNVSGSRLGVVFESSWWALLIMTCMALSNGYVSTLSMIYGPQRVEYGPDSEIAGSIMILALTFGLFSGSMLSYFVAFVVLG
jgi:equilibrative nucleoside transporter 1/2/3